MERREGKRVKFKKNGDRYESKVTNESNGERRMWKEGYEDKVDGGGRVR